MCTIPHISYRQCSVTHRHIIQVCCHTISGFSFADQTSVIPFIVLYILQRTCRRGKLVAANITD